MFDTGKPYTSLTKIPPLGRRLNEWGPFCATVSWVDSILVLLFCKQSRSVQDIEFSIKFHRSLPDCGQRRSPPLILSTRMPHPYPRRVCFVVAKFGLNRLRRSPSSSPNPFGGFHHFACMQACKFKPARSPAHSHHLIIQNRFVHNVLHILFNVLA